MGRLPYKSPKQTEREKREKAKLDEAIHRVIYLCQMTGISKETAVGIVRDKCLIGYREAREGVERYWQEKPDFSKAPWTDVCIEE